MAKPFLDVTTSTDTKRERIKYFHVGTSSINDKGTFASQDIPDDAGIGVAIYKARFTGDASKDYVRDNLGKFTNHSDKPNLKIIKKGQFYIYQALKKIKKGTELTVDFNDFDFEASVVFLDNYAYINSKDGGKVVTKLIELKEIPKITFVKIGEHNNAGVMLDGKNMRYRGEVLIFNEDKTEMFMCFKENGEYYVPGGSAEPNKTIEEQIVAETREEAGLEITEVKHSGIQTTKMFNGEVPQWHKDKLHPNGVVYDGYLTEIFVAKYVSKITGEVSNTVDIDLYMRKHGKFYKISDHKNKIRKEHLAILPLVDKLL